MLQNRERAGGTMTFANVSRALVTVGTLLLAAPVGAAEVSYHLSGKVNYIQGTAQAKLAGLGVTNGANVSIDWTVELTTPPYFDNPNGTKEYHGAITAMKIQIGTWTTQGADPTAFNTIPVNKIDIYHGPTAPHEDDLEMRRSGVDTSDPNTGLGLVTGNDPNDALIFIRLVALMGGASTDNVLGDQDPSKYLDTSGGSVTGVDGVVGFAIPGVAGPPPPDPTVKCRTAQIASAATLCQSTLKCLAVRAKQTPAQIAKNPASLQTCRDKASSKFVTAFDKATASAVAKSLSCGTTEPAATFVTHFDTAVDDVVAVVDTVTPPNALLSSSWYSDAAVMCAAAVKAESKDVKKPSPAKLDQLRATARAKAITVANKAIAKAEKKGVTFDPAPDVTALVDSIDALIDDIVTELNGS
jgi:hypothetical protein